MDENEELNETQSDFLVTKSSLKDLSQDLNLFIPEKDVRKDSIDEEAPGNTASKIDSFTNQQCMKWENYCRTKYKQNKLQILSRKVKLCIASKDKLNIPLPKFDTSSYERQNGPPSLETTQINEVIFFINYQ